MDREGRVLLLVGGHCFGKGKEGEWWGLLRYMANGHGNSNTENGELSEGRGQIQAM